ncbi:penicillin acylase family protein [Trinickia diaoshuihuensis]|uniref:penicillin acylase family protein n=1 Tax=Trinickia diaoshuihuensis TaxID=2292265 RepID=UPI000E22D243|nr:penicillin acylase family protein [Trinickia diaoshuihuensis]
MSKLKARRGLRSWRAALFPVVGLLAVMLPLASRAQTVHPGMPQDVAAHTEIAIYRTDYGIPHIEAPGWVELGLGVGYAQASDNLCTLGELFATLRGTRSAYRALAGRPHADSILGEPDSLDSDFFFKLVMTPERLASYRNAQRPQLQGLVDGFAQGYNRFLAELQAGRAPGRHVACKDAAWLTPIDADDVYRRMIEISLAGGALRFVGSLVHALPPSAQQRPPRESTVGALAGSPVDDAQALEIGGAQGIGSNALALSGSMTDSGRALLFGNPHWFWAGPDRFYQAQMKIDGQIDVAGAMFLGVPLVVIGFNHDVAWTHTVSTARRFGLFRLSLVPGDATAYWFDGRRESMTSRVVSVEVADASGARHSVSRRFYQSRAGMLVNLAALSGQLRWTEKQAYALDDANLSNLHAFDTYLGWAQARSLAELIAVQRRYAAVPWANTLAIGAHEPRVWFADIGPVPGVSDSLERACGIAIADDRWSKIAPRVPVLDGSRGACDWHGDADSVEPRTLGLSQLPQRLSGHYAANMNDSYWLTDPARPMPAGPAILGPVDVAQSLRTRLGHEIVNSRLQARDGYPGHRFNVPILQKRVLDSTSMSAQLFKGDLLAGVCPQGYVTISHDPLTGASLDSPKAVDVTAACAVLRRWRGDADAGARGANLWDEFWSRIDALGAKNLFEKPFDPRAPLATPAGLRASDPRVQEAFGLAVAATIERGDALDAPRGDKLYLPEGEARLPLYGGCAAAGYFTVVCSSHDGVHVAAMGEHGHGNSYMQIVDFPPSGVQAYTLLSTSESDDPGSSHFRDASRRYADKRWLAFPFDDAQIIRRAAGDSVLLGW